MSSLSLSFLNEMKKNEIKELQMGKNILSTAICLGEKFPRS